MSTLSLFDWPGAKNGDGEERDHVYRVSEINRVVRTSLEEGFRGVWIEGELADVTRAASGHVYFTLADEKDPAQLKGVIFRNDARRAKATLETGQRVRMRGNLSLYEPRGVFQLIARVALPAGGGDLLAAFERIRRKLEGEGLFASERKRPLPRLPEVVGVVTSRSGAALQDIIRVAAERCPVRLVVSDCRVQGADAPASIVRALTAIQRLPELDVIIVGRGGGSQEELWAFNDEAVARAIAECRVPVVSAVGHEVDVSISDLVADVRASTPSNAAELVVPDRRALQAEQTSLTRRLERALDTHLGQDRLRLERLLRRLPSPTLALARSRRRLDERGVELDRHIRRHLRAARVRLEALAARARRGDPRAALARDRHRLLRLRQRLDTAMERTLVNKRRGLTERTSTVRGLAGPMLRARAARLETTAGRLDAMSPLKVLARGYAIVLAEDTGKAVVRATDAEVGRRVGIRLSSGQLRARVEEVIPS